MSVLVLVLIIIVVHHKLVTQDPSPSLCIFDVNNDALAWLGAVTSVYKCITTIDSTQIVSIAIVTTVVSAAVNDDRDDDHDVGMPVRRLV